MSSYYEFTGETIRVGDATLHRIRAVTDLPRHGVRAGDVGGWIAGTANLSGGARVFGDAWVYGDAEVFGGAQVSGRAWVFGDAQVFGGAEVSGAARVFGDAEVCVSQDVLTVGPIGSESVTATLFRTANSHRLHVGCWDGQVDDLAAEVERRSAAWDADPATAARWVAEYTALETLCRARMAGWAAIQ